MEEHTQGEEYIDEKKYSYVKVTKNDTKNGCIATAKNLHQIFTCNTCNQQKDQSICIAFKINEVLTRK